MKKLSLCLFACCSLSVTAQNYYKAPPTSSTLGYVPVISDELMKVCVERYNQAEWIEQELRNTYVDQYSQASVNAYNAKVNRQRQLTQWFNANCAGKQSRSACEAARELNRQNGIEHQSCY